MTEVALSPGRARGARPSWPGAAARLFIAALAGYGAAHLTRFDEEGAAQAAFHLKQDDVAFAIWRARGARAEAQIAYFYRKGLGVARDETAAEEHFRAAVALDEAAAEHTTGLLYLARPTERGDYLRAREYCDLALRNGVAAALACREQASTLLSHASSGTPAFAAPARRPPS